MTIMKIMLRKTAKEGKLGCRLSCGIIHNCH